MKGTTTLQRLLMAQKNEKTNLVDFISNNSKDLWGDVQKLNVSLISGDQVDERKSTIKKNETSIKDRMSSLLEKRFLVNKLNNETKVNIKDIFTGKDKEVSIAEAVIIRDTLRDIISSLISSQRNEVRSMSQTFSTVFKEWDSQRSNIQLQSGEGNEDIVRMMLERHEEAKPTLVKNGEFIEMVNEYFDYLSDEIDIVLSEINSLTTVEI